jgi:hypothetical protein
MDEVVDLVEETDLFQFEIMWGPVEVTSVAFPDTELLKEDESNAEEVDTQYNNWMVYARGFLRGMFGDIISNLTRRIEGNRS